MVVASFGFLIADTDNCSCVSLLFLSVIPFYAFHPTTLFLLSVSVVSSDLGTKDCYHTTPNTVDLLFRLYTPRTIILSGCYSDVRPLSIFFYKNCHSGFSDSLCKLNGIKKGLYGITYHTSH